MAGRKISETSGEANAESWIRELVPFSWNVAFKAPGSALARAIC
jgi:hypothetical protein